MERCTTKKIMQINQWKYVNIILQYFHWHSSLRSHRVLHHFGLTSCNISPYLPYIILLNGENWFFFIIKVKTSFSLPPSETVADCNKKEKNMCYLSFMVLEISELHIIFEVLATFTILLTTGNMREENLMKPAVTFSQVFPPHHEIHPRPFNHCPGTWSHNIYWTKYFLLWVATTVLLRWTEPIGWYMWESRYLNTDLKRT